MNIKMFIMVVFALGIILGRCTATPGETIQPAEPEQETIENISNDNGFEPPQFTQEFCNFAVAEEGI